MWLWVVYSSAPQGIFSGNACSASRSYRSPSRLIMLRLSTLSAVRLPPLSVPPTNPPWSFAWSRSPFAIRAYSSALSGVRIGFFSFSFSSA